MTPLAGLQVDEAMRPETSRPWVKLPPDLLPAYNPASSTSSARKYLAHRNRISRKNFSPLPQPELSRMVGLLHGQRLRNASRARVQRHPQRLRADRYFSALQISDHRERRDPPGEPRDYTRHQQGESRKGHLLL